MAVPLCGALWVWSLSVWDMWFWAAMSVNVLTCVYITSMNWYNYSVFRRMALEEHHES